MSIVRHPALRAVGVIAAAVVDILVGGPLNFALKLGPSWAVVLFAAIVYGIIGAAIFQLFGTAGIAVAGALLAIWCIARRNSTSKS